MLMSHRHIYIVTRLWLFHAHDGDCLSEVISRHAASIPSLGHMNLFNGSKSFPVREPLGPW